MFKKAGLFLFLAALVLARSAGAQQKRWYLDSLISITVRNYPLIKTKRLQSQALQEAVKGKQSTFIPSLAASYQADYATYNNITGMIYPQYIMPISGPPSQGNNYSGTPGSAAALNLLWEPVTFGQRQAEVDLAKGNLIYGKADESLTVFQQEIYVINAWLNYSMLTSLAKVYQQNIDRMAFNLKQSQTLVTSGLRPGTDSASFQAELTRANIQLLNFERQRDSCFHTLAEQAGGKLPDGLTPDTALFNTLPPLQLPDTGASRHPEIQLMQARVSTNELALNALKKNILPKLTVWSVAYGRGSGVAVNGSVNAADGWGFERYNYGFGLQLSIPVLEIFRQKHLWMQQRLNTDASREQLELSKLHINTQEQIAADNLIQARKVAALTPIQRKSAVFAYEAVLSRYHSGLVNYYDVIQAQQLVFQSEASVVVAYYNAWKSLLNKAAYNGNLDIFLKSYRQ